MAPRARYVGKISLNVNAAYGQKQSSYHGAEFVFEDARTSAIESVKRRHAGWGGAVFAGLNFQQTSRTADCGRRWIAAEKMGGLS